MNFSCVMLWMIGNNTVDKRAIRIQDREASSLYKVYNEAGHWWADKSECQKKMFKNDG